MEMFSLKDKTAIIVGGSKGLGKGMAKGMALAGANVVLVSRNQNELDATGKELSLETGSTVIGISADVTNSSSRVELINKVAEKFGSIDILLNGAGLNVRDSALEFTEEGWDKVQDVQLKSVFFLCQEVAKHMIANNVKGKIINIGSLTSQLGLRNMVSYVAAKGAIVQLTKAMANEFADYGINVNAILPGYYETEMTKPLFENKEYRDKLLARIPMQRFGMPDNLMGAAVFLASEASDYVTGVSIPVDGGWLAC